MGLAILAGLVLVGAALAFGTRTASRPKAVGMGEVGRLGPLVSTIATATQVPGEWDNLTGYLNASLTVAGAASGRITIEGRRHDR